ncbi:MAG: hypothetical protein R3E32_17220 [Chitinophagales bacterium]
MTDIGIELALSYLPQGVKNLSNSYTSSMKQYLRGAIEQSYGRIKELNFQLESNVMARRTISALGDIVENAWIMNRLGGVYKTNVELIF